MGTRIVVGCQVVEGGSQGVAIGRGGYVALRLLRSRIAGCACTGSTEADQAQLTALVVLEQMGRANIGMHNGCGLLLQVFQQAADGNPPLKHLKHLLQRTCPAGM